MCSCVQRPRWKRCNFHLFSCLYANTQIAKETVSSVVMDGVSVQRPCCGSHNCKNPLPTNRHHFCTQHSHLKNICAIVDCNQPIISGKHACSDPVHQDVERVHTERGQAQLQLKERLKRAQVTHPNDALAQDSGLAADDGVEDVEFDVLNNGRVVPSTVESSGMKKIRAKFSRNWTHNEQLIICPCGIILARETFYGAESVSSAAVKLHFYLFIPSDSFIAGNDQAHISHPWPYA